MTVSQKAVEAALAAWLGLRRGPYGSEEMADMGAAITAALPHLTPTEASAPVQPEPDAGLVEAVIRELENQQLDLPRPPELKRLAKRIIKALGNSSQDGWLFFNEDTGTEWSENHPVNSGECEDATDIRAATASELKSLLIEAWTDLEALRRTQPSTAQPSQGEAVAWRFTSADINGEEWPWTYTENRALAERAPLHEPLYATPPAPVDVGAAVAAERERCARIAEEFGPSRPIATREPSKLIVGRWEGEQAASSGIAAAIRQSTVGEPKEGGENG